MTEDAFYESIVAEGKIDASQLAPSKLFIGGKSFPTASLYLFDELVASLEETLAVAVRNETGEFADRAQSLLQKIRGEA